MRGEASSVARGCGHDRDLGVALAAGTAPGGAAANAWPHTVVNGFSTPSGSGLLDDLLRRNRRPVLRAVPWRCLRREPQRADRGRRVDAQRQGLLARRRATAASSASATPTSTGAWVARSLNRPVFSMAPTTTGKGIGWSRTTAASSASVTRSSTDPPAISDLAEPINGITTSATGHGYRMVARDGGIFSFGDAQFYGSVPGKGLHIDDVVGYGADAEWQRATGSRAVAARSTRSVTRSRSSTTSHRCAIPWPRSSRIRRARDSVSSRARARRFRSARRPAGHSPRARRWRARRERVRRERSRRRRTPSSIPECPTATS